MPLQQTQRAPRLRGADTGSFGVLVVDDQEIAGLGLRVALSAQPWVRRCLFTVDLPGAVALATRYDLHLAVVGARVGGLDGVTASRRLLTRVPHLRTIVLGDVGPLGGDDVRRAGAWGSVGRDWTARRIVEAVRAVARGERPPVVASGGGSAGAGGGILSPQQLRVLRLIAEGTTNREIAVALGLSPHTVKDHVAELVRRLEVRNRAQAVQQGQRLGLIA